MKWVACFALFFLSLSLVSAQDADEGCTNAACQAFVWAYPLWSTVNHRYLNALSPIFTYNNFTFRVSSVPVPGQIPQLTTCNADVCNGVPSIPLNPSPVNVPYRYFLYGAWTFDFGTISSTYPGGAIKFVLPPNNLIRYASLVIYDAYSNIVNEFNSLNQQPGVPTVFCLAAVQPHPACANVPGPHFLLPRIGFAVLRAYTEGIPTPPCGYDGCLYILGSWQNFALIFPAQNVINDKVKYDPFMNQNECPYVFGEPPCGEDGNKNSFWDAVCLALGDTPVTGAEADYVENTFGSLGIHASGCNNLDYNKLNNGHKQGYKYVVDNLPNTGVTSGPWSFLPFSGNWNVHDLPSSLLRANGNHRILYMNSNQACAYWMAYRDTEGAPLSGAHNTTYKLVWRSTDPVVDATRGFWSVHLYTPDFYLYDPPAGTDQHQYSVLGKETPSGEISFANNCVNALCIRTPPEGNFEILLRFYVYFPNIGPNGGYQFPDIVKCHRNAPCN